MAKATKKSSYKVKVDPIGEQIKRRNNIIISLTNATVKYFLSSAGKMGFRGSKKNTLMLLKWLLKIVLKSLKKEGLEK